MYVKTGDCRYYINSDKSSESKVEVEIVVESKVAKYMDVLLSARLKH